MSLTSVTLGPPPVRKGNAKLNDLFRMVGIITTNKKNKVLLPLAFHTIQTV